MRIILWAGSTFMMVLILWLPVQSQYIKEHTKVVQVPPQNIIVNPPQTLPATPVKKASFRVTGVKWTIPTKNELMNFKVSAKNTGEADIRGPSYSFIAIPSSWILSDLGERHLFELVARRSSSKLINPDIDLYPGEQLAFETKDSPPTQIMPDDAMRKVSESRMYVLVLLQYGIPREHPFDDGLKKPHSVFCGFFEKPTDTNIHLCHGFNYVRPEE